jgi:NOL1/NOP2/fmu family ribosome biogenesis protein
MKQYAIIEWKHKLNLTDASVRDILSQWVWLHECGIPLMKPTGKTFSIEHECAIALWHLATKNTIELTTEELQHYCLGEDITISQERLQNYSHNPLCNGYVILIHHGLWVWVGKVIDGMIKNKFMKW